MMTTWLLDHTVASHVILDHATPFGFLILASEELSGDFLSGDVRIVDELSWSVAVGRGMAEAAAIGTAQKSDVELSKSVSKVCCVCRKIGDEVEL